MNAHRSKYSYSHSGAQTEDEVCLAYGFDISTLVAWYAIALQSAQ